MKVRQKAFTLIEMLIVIVIIGILAIALIPRLMGIQSRARDTARTADLRQISDAIVLYGVDNGGNYPPAFVGQTTSLPSWSLSASYNTVYAPHRMFAQVNTSLNENTQGTIAALGNNLKTYISLLPNDPSSKGIRAQSNLPDCITEDPNNTYGYFRDTNDTMYAITMVSEAGRGNSTNCGGTIDSRKGDYKTVGQGLIYAPSYYTEDGIDHSTIEAGTPGLQTELPYLSLRTASGDSVPGFELGGTNCTKFLGALAFNCYDLSNLAPFIDPSANTNALREQIDTRGLMEYGEPFATMIRINVDVMPSGYTTDQSYRVYGYICGAWRQLTETDYTELINGQITPEQVAEASCNNPILPDQTFTWTITTQ